MIEKPTEVRFHITASEAFPAMERVVLGAQHTLDISLHVLSPRTKTRDQASHERKLVDWSDLLIDASARGVDIRLLLNDFDPIGGPELHASVWERFEFLEQKLNQERARLRGNLVVHIGGPGGQSGAIIRSLVWPAARKLGNSYLKEFKNSGRKTPPRLAALCGSSDRLRYWPPAPNHTQTFHQKFFIADGRHVIVGGLDIDERRFDDMDHEVPAPETWHDLSAEFIGAEAEELSAHFEKSWQQVNTFGVCAFDFQRGNINADVPATVSKSKNKLSIVTTAGTRTSNPFAFGPSSEVTSLEQIHVNLISNAKSFIYIETQYLRSSTIRDALIAAGKANPELHLFILLPAAPDVIAFNGEKSPVHRYGEWLQMRALYRISKVFGDRMGAFCLTNNIARDEEIERDALHGKSVVYVHSKLIIRDDSELVVSSANLNGRSMRWDFEAGIAFTDRTRVKQLRQQLWASHLGDFSSKIDPTNDAAGAMQIWKNAADDWRNDERRKQPTGVVPFPMKKTRRFAKRHFFIPENMV